MRILQSIPPIGVILIAMALACCSTQHSDELALRNEFEIPRGAAVTSYETHPKEPGWFGREGLKVDIVFQLNDDDFRHYATKSSTVTQWRPLPIPEEFLRRMAAIETTKRSLVESYERRGEAPPAEGSVYNPTEQQMLDRFLKSLPPQPSHGLFQIRTAGDNIMHAPKSLYDKPDRDLNDFMLAMLDTDRKQIIIKVSTGY